MQEEDHTEDKELLIEREKERETERDISSVSCSGILTMVAHFICVLYTGYMIYVSQPGSTLFSWHPALMTLAFMFLLMEGILIFSPQSSLLQQKPRKTKTTWHWIFMSCAAVCALAGYIIIYISKEQKEKPHLTSWHGKIGFATLIYVLTQMSTGLNLLYPRFISRYVRLATLKLLHATSGLLLSTMIVSTLVTGMLSSWFVREVTGTSWYACVVCPPLLLLIIANQVKNAYINK